MGGTSFSVRLGMRHHRMSMSFAEWRGRPLAIALPSGIMPGIMPASSMAKGSKRISGIASSLRQLGEMQVNDWDFEGLMHKDVRDIEFSKSLRRLGSIRVMEWDFKDVLPAVNKLAHQEVDIVNMVKRVADYKVMEWDFRSSGSSESKPARKKRDVPAEPRLSAEEMQALVIRLKDFLQFAVVNLIDEPGHAHVKVREIAPNVLRFRLVLVRRDVSTLIGMEGHTAGAIRRILKSAAAAKGVDVLLRIVSHEEEITLGDDDSAED
jgi:predicted RNA-binding protein YlqC (UPF0109 family)